MKFTKFDIGADIISILTRGMYPDPKDALREYIQNGVDAKANHINVKIRQNNIIVQDNGFGMNHEVLRRAARIGVSDKNPSKDVGFMGIGIYSAYHLCDSLIITSRCEGGNPNRLKMNFQGMKSLLKEQRDLRLEGTISSEQLIDLQSLLESFVQITENGELNNEDFPSVGTRVEIQGVSEYFYSEISNFETTAKYLQDVVPLKFNHQVFKYSEEIEQSIIDACKKNNSHIEMINLTLQVNSQTMDLYRPYSDSDFENGSPLAPILEELIYDGEFFGVVWGCLNTERKKIKKTDLRGFLIKKQGFAIGKRSDVVRFFPRANTFFDRYIGEIIITNSLLLPNASRNDLEYSPLRERFFSVLAEAASKYDFVGNKHQEDCMADERLDSYIQSTKGFNLDVMQNQQNTDVLIGIYTKLTNISSELDRRIKTKRIRDTRFTEAKILSSEVKKLLLFIKQRIDVNNVRKSENANNSSAKLKVSNPTHSISNKLDNMQTQNPQKDPAKNYESLLSLIDDLEFKYDDNIKFLLDIIDERFIQAAANSKEDYFASLEAIRLEFLNEED